MVNCASYIQKKSTYNLFILFSGWNWQSYIGTAIAAVWLMVRGNVIRVKLPMYTCRQLKARLT